MDRKNQIVNDGQRRAYDASINQVRAEVEAKYAEELKKADAWKTVQVRRKVEGEIKERMERMAPKSGLY